MKSLIHLLFTFTLCIVIVPCRLFAQTPVPTKTDIIPSKFKDSMAAVTVTAKKPLLEYQVDRTVVNVDAMISAPGSTALEILEKTPGVVLDLNGGISLNGKTGVLILIDGRATQMSASDLNAYLRSLPGGTLDKIELIENPPARYDAGGNAIINIKLKKNKLQGFNGSVTSGYSQGVYARSVNSLLLGYSRKNLNITSSVGYNYDAGFNSNNGYRTYTDAFGKIVSFMRMDGRSKNFGNAVNGRIAVDYKLTDRTNIGAIYNANRRSAKDQQYYNNLQGTDQTRTDSVFSGITEVNSDASGTGYNLNFFHRGRGDGEELSADLNYSKYKNEGLQYLFNRVSNDQAIFDETVFSYQLPSSTEIYSGQVDYVRPMKGKARIDFGAKGSHVINDAALDLIGELPANAVPQSDRSNRFIYKETIAAGYVNARKEFRRFSMQAGLRVENTMAAGNQLADANGHDFTFKRSYLNLFPGLFVTYKADTNNIHFFDLSFSRRIRRPNYQSLNPFLYFVDNYSYSVGNPELRPQFGNQIDLRYRYKRLLSVGVQHGIYSNVIFTVVENKDQIVINSPSNVADGYITSFVTNLNLPVTKWWTSNINVNFYRLKLKGVAGKQVLDQETFSVRGSLNNQFMIAKGFTGELNLNYNGQNIAGQKVIAPYYRINAGLQKKLLKDKASIRVVAEDVFYTNRQVDETRGIAGLVATNTNWSDSRRIGISFTWAFGKDKGGKKRTLNENSAAEEKSRVD
ncbi:MAG: outer membrane beta-barrel protein [Flavitalea sp.]